MTNDEYKAMTPEELQDYWDRDQRMQSHLDAMNDARYDDSEDDEEDEE